MDRNRAILRYFPSFKRVYISKPNRVALILCNEPVSMRQLTILHHYFGLNETVHSFNLSNEEDEENYWSAVIHYMLKDLELMHLVNKSDTVIRTIRLLKEDPVIAIDYLKRYY